MKIQFWVMWLVAVLALHGCQSDKANLIEKAAVEGKANSEAVIQAENTNLATKALEMEADLALRHRFYQAVAGTYEGKMSDQSGRELNLRIMLVPSLPPYQTSRVRTLGEIEADLNNLYFNAKTLQWNQNNTVASGCVFEQIKPDMATGSIELVAANCSSTYSVRLGDLKIENASTQIAAQLLHGQTSSVSSVSGIRQSNTRAVTFLFSAHKVSAPGPVPELSNSTVDEDLDVRVREMESDLAQRHKFYQALKGTYEGTMTAKSGVGSIFKFRLTLVPSLPPYSSGRTRTVEEITSDLNNLNLNIQVVQWNPENNLSAVGCRIQGVRPDFANGEINIASENCPNFYSLRLEVAEGVRSGKLGEVTGVSGEVHPTTNATIYQVSANRVKQ